MKSSILCIEPGRGSIWLYDATLVQVDNNLFVEGYAEDNSNNDTRMLMHFPANLVICDPVHLLKLK